MASTTFNPITKDKLRSDEHMEQATEAGQEALQKTKETGDEALQKVKEAGGEVLGKAKEAAVAVGEMASHAASAVGHKADDLTASAGHGIKEFGDTISKKAPHEGLTGAASQAVAEGVKSSGQYIEEQKLSGMAHDVEQVVKNHPIPALLICFGIGFCLGRVLKD